MRIVVPSTLEFLSSLSAFNARRHGFMSNDRVIRNSTAVRERSRRRRCMLLNRAVKFVAMGLAFALLALGTRASAKGPKPVLEEVASFGNQQATGVAVSPEGRIFVNFPDWSDNHDVSVVEVMKDGSLQPFPDAEWNSHEGPPDSRWICVQSVYFDETGALWVLDPASPKMAGVVKDGPKLVKFDINTRKVSEKISFDEAIAPDRAYLNDVRVDARTGHAYITESGIGSMIVVDLHTRNPRRVLVDDASTKAEPDTRLKIGGVELIDPKSGKTPKIHCDGIAFDREHGFLYFHALTGHKLHRLKLEDLRNPSLSDQDLSARVETVGTTAAPDGMLAGSNGTVYLTDLEQSSVVRWNADSKTIETVVEDDRLQWPDSLAWGPDGSLYITASQIHLSPRFNKGENKERLPFRLYRVALKAH